MHLVSWAFGKSTDNFGSVIPTPSRAFIVAGCHDVESVEFFVRFAIRFGYHLLHNFAFAGHPLLGLLFSRFESVRWLYTGIVGIFVAKMGFFVVAVDVDVAAAATAQYILGDRGTSSVHFVVDFALASSAAVRHNNGDRATRSNQILQNTLLTRAHKESNEKGS